MERRSLVLILLVLLGSPTFAYGQGLVVEVFGIPIETQDVVFCVDRSGSMLSDWPDVREELIEAFGQLEPTQRFSVVLFGSTLSVSSTALVPATVAAVDDAIQLVSATNPQGTTCLLNGLDAALDLAETGQPGDRSIVLIGNGGESCFRGVDVDPPTFVADLVLLNPELIQIDSITTPTTTSSGLETYWLIAQTLGGEFWRSDGRQFTRGDADLNGQVDLQDAITILQSSGSFPSGSFPCAAARDVNADGTVEPISDAVALLSHLFLGAPLEWPAPPFCGQSAEAAALTCFVAPPGC